MNRTDIAGRMRSAIGSDRFSRSKKFAADYAVMTFGAAVYALSVSFFTAPNEIAPGGVTGLSTMLNYLLHVPIGATSLILNIPLFIWGAVKSGARFIRRTAAASAAASLLIDLASFIPFRYTGDRMLAAIFGGLFCGAGLGVIFLRGGSTGGTDIIGRNLHVRFPYLSVGTIILISDAAVIVLSALVYGSVENALYAVIAIFVSTKMIDAVVFGFSRDNGKLLLIVTSFPCEMTAAILRDADTGATVIPATGAYTGQKKSVILSVTHPRDLYRVKACVAATDPDAFMITATATAVSGLGYSASIPRAKAP